MPGLLDYMQQDQGLLGGPGLSQMLMATGAGLLGGQGWGGALQAGMAAQQQQRKDMLQSLLLRHQLGKDERDFAFRQAEAQRAQGNADRTFGLQERGFGLTDDIKEFNLAKQQGFTGTLEQWMQRKRAGAGEYGLQPIWGIGPDGKPAVMQLGKGGEGIRSKLPEGFEIANKPIEVDTKTATVLLDPQTRQPIATIPKQIAEAARQKEVGESRGQAEAGLPSVLNTAEQTKKLIDDMLEHPGRETATGMSRWVDPRNYLAGTDAANFAIRSQQMEGRTFLQAFESLKGAGAITEVEGTKATAAIARLNRSQSDAEYAAALRELKEVIDKGVAVARQKAGLPASGAAPAPAGGGWSVQEVK